MKWSWLIILVFWSPILGQELTYQSSSKLPQPLEESSGLVIASDTSFYTINDSGNDPILFEINHSGKIIRKIQIKGQNKDWEELAKDEKGNIYIGDFGNNLNSRKDLKIYKLNHSDLHLNEIKPTVYSFAYPDQKQFPPEKYELHFDCEAFVIHEGKAYLFTKNRTEPFDGISNVYQVNLESSKTEIKKIGEIQLCKDGWYPCSVTSASYENGQLGITF